MNDLLVLLATIASLLANPKVQANPVYLSDAESISNAASALVEEYTAVQAENNPSSTYNLGYSAELGDAVQAPSSTPTYTEKICTTFDRGSQGIVTGNLNFICPSDTISISYQ